MTGIFTKSSLLPCLRLPPQLGAKNPQANPSTAQPHCSPVVWPLASHTTGKRLHLMPQSPLSWPHGRRGFHPQLWKSHHRISNSQQRDDSHFSQPQPSLQTAQQGSLSIQETHSPSCGHRPILPALSAGQDTNRHNHKLFVLVSGFKEGGCSNMTGEEQLLLPFLHDR